ncbi:hypothetical protein [Chryseobacterium luquanense]|uniref:Uncharacterized protein n=1 Tax=Chryseobacterium luquanense TaxID=2983766 RepID=A0ABT3Y3G5_9FLAO|nr:hypothetical protein [Chryseobacterium luquanense]MCX8532676.1 hypothetical protein [Chryseobacterium luquanense]
MEFIKQHISHYLYSFLNEKPSKLDGIVSLMQNDLRAEFTDVIHYLNNVLDETFSSNNDGVTPLHIHFEDEFSECQKLVIAEFLSIKSFKNYQNKIIQNGGVNNELYELLFSLKTKNSKCPDGASAQKKNKIWKEWIQEINNNKSLVDFYKGFDQNSFIKPKLLLNTQTSFCHLLNQLFRFRPFAIAITSKYQSINLLNATQTLNEIDTISNEIINELDSIVLFDCERKSLMSSFSFEEINKWNSDYETRFTKYLIITFGKEYQSINNTKNKIELVKDKFKLPTNSSYTINKSEIDFVLKRKEKSSISIEFVGFESSSFWDTFLLETSIRELYELRSIKLMNIYSICYTDVIKRYIIEDLFSKEESSELISSSTKMAILELRDEDIETLKEALSITLDLIINSQCKLKIIKNLSNTETIIFDEAILRNVKLLSMITTCLGLTKSINLKTWSDLLNLDSNCFIIISYRDQGKYPNLLEIEFDSKKIVSIILPNFLFGHHYKWAKYYLLKEYYKLLTHPIRENHFEWNKLQNTIQTLKPEKKLNIDWNLESEYSNSEQRDSFKIKLKNQRAKTFNNSNLFIVSDDKNITRKVVKIDFLISLENDDSKVYVQSLDEIQDDINIYEKIIDKKQQEEELEVIRKQFNLGDETAGRLWKVLLKNLAKKLGEDALYFELKKHFETKGLKIVSQFHFKNSWINPQSESIAPLSKRTFIELCEYLKIPKIYFVIIQRIRNASKQSSRQSTRQMIQLLKDLCNDGCFDNDKNAREIITNRLGFYKSNHPLEELGIDENYLADNLVTLTELIQPELKLLELETIEKLSNE